MCFTRIGGYAARFGIIVADNLYLVCGNVFFKLVQNGVYDPVKVNRLLFLRFIVGVIKQIGNNLPAFERFTVNLGQIRSQVFIFLLGDQFGLSQNIGNGRFKLMGNA